MLFIYVKVFLENLGKNLKRINSYWNESGLTFKDFFLFRRVFYNSNILKSGGQENYTFICIVNEKIISTSNFEGPLKVILR